MNSELLPPFSLLPILHSHLFLIQFVLFLKNVCQILRGSEVILILLFGHLDLFWVTSHVNSEQMCSVSETLSVAVIRE